jgi:hypothetical protein
MEDSHPAKPAFADARVSKLTEEAGSEASISRGKHIAAAVIVIGFVGALGSAMRPILRQKYGASTARKPLLTISQRPQLTSQESARLQALLARMRELQYRHRARHPLWYGEPTVDMVLAAEEHVSLRNAGVGSVPVLR